MHARRRSVIVVGGGIFGVTAALELCSRGLAVELIDPGPLPHQHASSTDISKAVRMDYGADAFYAELAELALDGWRTWNREWTDPPYHEVGFLLMRREAMAPGTFEGDGFELMTRRGHPVQRIDPGTLESRFPAWCSDSYRDGYLNPAAGWAASGRVVAELVKRARASGVAIREGVRFERLAETGSRVAGIVTDDGRVLRADFVLVAAGAWTPTLLPQLADVMWAVGQPVLHFRPDDPALYRGPRFPVWGADISTTGWYGFPLSDEGILKIGHHGAGRPMHPDGDRTLDASIEERCRSFLGATFPDLAAAPLVGSRTCLYCDTWDGNFWIDHDPDRPGLVVAAGGSGHGFKFAPVLGAIIADVLERRSNRHAARFAWRVRGTIATEQARKRD